MTCKLPCGVWVLGPVVQIFFLEVAVQEFAQSLLTALWELVTFGREGGIVEVSAVALADLVVGRL